MEALQVAVIQLSATVDRDRNYCIAEQLIREAAKFGAEFIVLPEKWSFLGDQELLYEQAQPLTGSAVSLMKSLAKELSVDLVAGSVVERGVQGHRHNTSVHISSSGEVQAAYRKIHLFDAQIGTERYRESDHEQAGSQVITSSYKDHTFGMAICYDLRFPELFRSLQKQGAEFFVLPAAFTAKTTVAHWEVLLRARAIENQAFVLAANQVGTHLPSTMSSGGRSMIIDPWGTVLASLHTEEGWVTATIDFSLQSAIQTQLPVLQHQRTDLFP